MLVLAQTSINSLFVSARTILNSAIIFLISLAVCWFIWNVIQYAIAQDEEKKGDAKGQMVWGIIAIAVIVSIWGLVNILQVLFGTKTDKAKTNSELENMIPGVVLQIENIAEV
jgi:hypothetical protein